jgi:CelD/BcsL family acetyltransferase involved in cellulose biosynthesis
MVVQREHKLHIVRPLSFEGSEYSLPLVEPDDHDRQRVGQLWQAARSVADLALLPQVRADSILQSVLGKKAHWRAVYGVEDAPFVRRATHKDWDAYRQTLSAKLRYEINRGWRRLKARGEVCAHVVCRSEIAALVDWMLDRKKQWMAQRNAGNDWVGTETYRNFLESLLTREDSTGRALLFALKVNGTPVAASFVSVDRTRLEGHLAAYDAGWQKCSPGNVLTEYIVRWAFERGLDVDFRIGNESYKRRWAGQSSETATWLVATGVRGMPRVARLVARLLLNRAKQRLAPSREPSAS